MPAQPPILLALISDVFFSAPIESIARAAGCQFRLVERPEAVEPDAPAGPRPPGEPLTGRGAGFIARVVEWQPALIVVELSSQTLPWRDWIAALKSSAATRRTPVIAFGPHVDASLRDEALDVGCDQVVTKGKLLGALPGLIAEYARRPNAEALRADCEGRLSDQALEGVRLFNAGEFFEAHEALEHAWNDEPGPARELYRGILQVAVAYLQITRGNFNGALKMFMRLRQWLDPLPDRCRGVNVARLRAEAMAARAELERLGPEGIGRFDRTLFQPIHPEVEP